MEAVNAGVQDIAAAKTKTVELERLLRRNVIWADEHPRVRLGEICEVRSGVGFPKALQGRPSGDVPFGKVRAISDAWQAGSAALADSTDYVTRDELGTVLKAKPFPSGTVVMAKIGEAVKLNRRALLTTEMLMDNNCMGWVPDETRVLPAYLFHLSCTIDLEPMSRATTVPSVRKSDVVELEVPCPSLETQRNIVRRIEAVRHSVGLAERQVESARTMEAGLRRSLLHRAMTGQLVPQDPADEPASELLKRIEAEKAEREAELKAARRRTRKDRSGSSAETAEALPRPPSQSGKVGTSSD